MRRSIIALLFALAGCNGVINGPSPGNTDPDGVELDLVGVDNSQLFDVTIQSVPATSSSKVVQAIVTIDEIDAHVDEHGKHSWVPILKTPVTVDLLKLDGKTLNTLGISTLPQGHVDGLRLVLNPIGDYVVLKNGTKEPLLAPNNNIINIDGKLDLDGCAKGIVIVDFDPHITKANIDCKHTAYELSCGAHIKTCDTHGVCGDMAGSTTPPAPDMAGTHPAADMTQMHTCTFCPTGQICDTSTGMCIDNPCNGVFCSGGQTCNPQTGMCQ